MERINFTKVETDYNEKSERFTRKEIKDGVSMPLEILQWAIITIQKDYKGSGDYYLIEYGNPDFRNWHRYKVKENPLEFLKN